MTHDSECEQRGLHRWIECGCAARAAAIATRIEAWVVECEKAGA